MARLGAEEIEKRLSKLDGWSRQGEALVRERKGENFLGSLEFVNRLAPVAEDMDHHPDLAISWDTVTVTITTHSEGGLTEKDFTLAERIDALS
jgi:4a-hydroxytetrahydrobiopterin dehydratase